MPRAVYDCWESRQWVRLDTAGRAGKSLLNLWFDNSRPDACSPRFTSYSAFHAIKKHYCRFIPCNGRIQRTNSLELHKPCGHQIASYGTIVLDLLYVPYTGVKLPAYRSDDAPAAEALQVQGLLRFAKRPEAS